MLTQKDIELLEELFVTKIEFNSKINLLPTKKEFFSDMDEIMTELKAVRESQEAHASDHSRIQDRLETLEQKAGVISAF